MIKFRNDYFHRQVSGFKDAAMFRSEHSRTQIVCFCTLLITEAHDVRANRSINCFRILYRRDTTAVRAVPFDIGDILNTAGSLDSPPGCSLSLTISIAQRPHLREALRRASAKAAKKCKWRILLIILLTLDAPLFSRLTTH
jgi:hypothetical protein